MGDMQRRLYNLGVFDKVDMAIQNPDGDTERQVRDLPLHGRPPLLHRRWASARRLRRIGGSQTSLDNPGGATGVRAARRPGSQPLEPLGAGPQPEFQGPLFHAGPAVVAELPGAALSQRGRPQYLRDRRSTTTRATCSRSRRGGWKGRRRFRRSSRRRPRRCSRYTWRDVRWIRAR